MNFQLVIVALLFLGALFYVGRLIYKSIFTKKSCGSNCKCSIDFASVKPGERK